MEHLEVNDCAVNNRRVVTCMENGVTFATTPMTVDKRVFVYINNDTFVLCDETGYFFFFFLEYKE